MKEISPVEAKEWLAGTGNVRIIDCREEDEFKICKLPKAELICLSTFGYDAPEKLPDKLQPILVYCHHGMRSQTAAQFLVKRGYTNVASLKGGIEKWSTDVDSSVPRY